MLLSKAAKYTNLLITTFLRHFSCDGAARPSATPSRQRQAGVNEDTAETSVLRGLARLNRSNLADTPPQNGWKSYSVIDRVLRYLPDLAVRQNFGISASEVFSSGNP